MASFTYRRQLTIEWGQCDPAGIVFNSRFFEIFDTNTWKMFEAALGVKPHQLAAPHLALDRLDRLVLHGGGQRQAGEPRLAVDQHRAGAAFAAVAAGLGAGEADFLAQVIEQQNIVGDRVGTVAPVQPA